MYMRNISIIVCNNKIYFDNETIAEIRKLPDDSIYKDYKGELNLYESVINDGNYHDITELITTIDSLCNSYKNDIAKAIGHASPDRVLNSYCKEVTNI